jgi:hypothetical protein
MQINREEKAGKEPETTIATTKDGANARPINASTTTNATRAPNPIVSSTPPARSRSRHRTVSDEGQTSSSPHHPADRTHLPIYFEPASYASDSPTSPGNDPLVLPGTNVTLDSATATRPKAGGIAFPFSLGRSAEEGDVNASTVTLAGAEAPTPGVERGDSGGH